MSEPPCRSLKNIEILIELDRELRAASAEIGPMIAECGPNAPDVDWRPLRDQLAAAVAKIPPGQ